MQIGELARRFDVAPSKIRFLEDQGLVRPVRRTPAGYREYDESSADALSMILQAQSLGFTHDEIRGALAETKSHGVRLDYLIGQITRKLSELDRHIAHITEADSTPLGAAMHVAHMLVTMQGPDGLWPQSLNLRTGQAIGQGRSAAPISLMRRLNRLLYSTEFDPAIRQAEASGTCPAEDADASKAARLHSNEA